ncbi:MAG: hypothetical protein ACP5I8_06455 [Phycisphaerae bacterium]
MSIIGITTMAVDKTHDLSFVFVFNNQLTMDFLTSARAGNGSAAFITATGSPYMMLSGPTRFIAYPAAA